jgi:D-alanyl-D-alanine carboxypeptidase
VYNVNSQLGQPNLAGIKTGWTDEAGACYLVAINWQSGETHTLILSVVLGQDTLADAYAATSRLVNSAREGMQVVPILNRGTVVASLSNKWGGQTTAVPAEDVNFILWPGLAVATRMEPALNSSTVKRGADVGKVVVSAGTQQREVTLIPDSCPPRPLAGD